MVDPDGHRAEGSAEPTGERRELGGPVWIVVDDGERVRELLVRVRQPHHRCLRIGEPDEPVNLHCYPPDHAAIRRYLLFRDRLRADEDDRRLYEETKRSLAGRVWPDVNYYAEAKQPVIDAILMRAGWTPPARDAPGS